MIKRPFTRHWDQWPEVQMVRWPEDQLGWCSNGQMSGWSDGPKTRCPKSRCLDVQIGQMFGYLDVWMVRCPDVWMVRCPDGQKTRWSDVQMASSPNSQISKWLYIYKSVYYVYIKCISIFWNIGVALATPATPLTTPLTSMCQIDFVIIFSIHRIHTSSSLKQSMLPDRFAQPAKTK